MVLIVCEGETEFEYFNWIKKKYRANWIMVKNPKRSDPMGIVDYAIQRTRELQREGADVEPWVVFDAESVEDEKPRQYREALDKAAVKKIGIANSSPCFEYWVLLHFCYLANVVTPRQALDELTKDNRLPNYRKPDLPSVSLWKAYEVGVPSQNAGKRRTELERLGEDPRFGRPVTYVDKLIGRICEIASRP